MTDEHEEIEFEKETIRGLFWVMLVFMAGAGALIWHGLTGDSSEWDGPRWMLVMFGLTFFNAFLGVGLMDKMFNAYRQNWLFAGIQVGALLSAPLMLLVMFNWVAFGPGEREFSVSISIPFLTGYFPNSNQWLGRAVFGIVAGFVDLVVLGAAGKMVWDWVNGDGGKWRW